MERFRKKVVLVLWGKQDRTRKFFRKVKGLCALFIFVYLDVKKKVYIFTLRTTHFLLSHVFVNLAEWRISQFKIKAPVG